MHPARVTQIQNSLRKIFFGPNLILRSLAIERAKDALEQKRGEFTQGLASEIEKIGVLAKTATGEISETALEDGITRSAVVYNLAGTLGYLDLQAVAASLYDLLVVMSEKGLRCVDPIIVHAEAARLSGPGMPKLTDASHDQLLSHLKEVVAHFRDKPEPCAKGVCTVCPAKQHNA